MDMITIDGLVGTTFTIVMALVSAYFYRHGGKPYAKEKETKLKSSNSFKYFYRYIQVSTIVVSVSVFLIDSPYLFEIHHSLPLLYSGLSVASIAMVLFVTAKLNLGKHYSPCFDAYMPEDVIKNGLYKHIRHPIYTSNLLLLSGVFMATGSLWIGFNFAILGFYYVTSAYREEKELILEFPKYQEYMRHTNMFIPGFRSLTHSS